MIVTETWMFILSDPGTLVDEADTSGEDGSPGGEDGEGEDGSARDEVPGRKKKEKDGDVERYFRLWT